MYELKFLLDSGGDFLVASPGQDQLGKGSAQRLAKLVFLHGAGSTGRYDGAGAMANGEETLLLKSAISDGDRVEVDAEIPGHLPNRGKSCSLPEVTPCDQRFHAVNDLLVERAFIIGIDGQEYRNLSVYCMHTQYC